MNDLAAKLAIFSLVILSILVSTCSAFGILGGAISKEVSPGEELEHPIVVVSSENESTLNMTAIVLGLAIAEDGSFLGVPPEFDTSPYSARQFLSVEPKNFTLKQGGQTTVLLKGIVPEDVGSGARYAMVSIETVPSDSEESVSVSFAIPVNVILIINNSDIIKTGEVSNLTASMSDDRVSIEFLLVNTGNVHYAPLISMRILDGAGEIVADQEPQKLDGEGFVIPMNSRLVQMALVPEAELGPGTYTIEVTATLKDGTVLDKENTTFEV